MIKWIIWTIVTIGILAIILGIYLQPNSFRLCPDNNGEPTTREGCNPAQAIVAISGGDTAARTKKAVELYRKGWAPLLIFSGAAEDKDGPSNAMAMRTDALAQGVPAQAILIEEFSENTSENAQNTRSLMADRGIKNVILVTSGYHQRRASLEFAAQTRDDGVTIRSAPTADKNWGWWWWLTPTGWWLAISEFAKIIALFFGGKL